MNRLASQIWPSSKHSISGLTPAAADARRHLAQDIRGRQECAVAEIERAAIERADLGQQFLDMGDALGGVRDVGSRPAATGMRGDRRRNRRPCRR